MTCVCPQISHKLLDVPAEASAQALCALCVNAVGSAVPPNERQVLLSSELNSGLRLCLQLLAHPCSTASDLLVRWHRPPAQPEVPRPAEVPQNPPETPYRPATPVPDSKPDAQPDI